MSRDQPLPAAWVVIGPSGSGKSTLGAGLAKATGAVFLEADDLHPDRNIEKMRRGEPLDDADRAPWLAAVGAAIGEALKSGHRVVAACSALKRAYRETLARAAGAPLFFVQTTVDRSELAARLDARRGHYMPTSLLDSQLEAFEPLGADEPGVALPAGLDPRAQVAACLQAASGTPSIWTR